MSELDVARPALGRMEERPRVCGLGSWMCCSTALLPLPLPLPLRSCWRCPAVARAEPLLAMELEAPVEVDGG